MCFDRVTMQMQKILEEKEKEKDSKLKELGLLHDQIKV